MLYGKMMPGYSSSKHVDGWREDGTAAVWWRNFPTLTDSLLPATHAVDGLAN